MNDVVYAEKKSDGIALLVINKPERKNALTGAMMDTLSEQLQKLDADDAVRVIIIKGEGGNFSAGGDLNQGGPDGLTIEMSRNLLKKYTRTIQVVQQIETPVIAMVDGYAVGGAMSLALACDIVYTSDRAKFVPNFLKVGIVPEMGAMLFLPQIIGPHRAKELWFTGRVISSEEGYRMGFVNKVCDVAKLEEDTLAFAKEIAALSSMAVKITKGIVNGAMSPMLSLIMDAESTASPFCSQTKEFKAIAARFSKKK